MDRDHFDRLIRAFAHGTTRRRLGSLFLALGSGAGAWAGLSRADAEGKRRKKRKRKRRKKQQPSADPACQPDCSGKSCGDDGCGRSCGTCLAPLVCDESMGQCVDDDGLCGVCPGGLTCHNGECCDPSCFGMICGVNNCGSSCGTCPIETPFCVNGGYACAPVPNLP